MEKNLLLRMDNIGIVVESLNTAICFFTELGLTLEGRTIIEGEWAGRVTGVRDQRGDCSSDWQSPLEIMNSHILIQ